jgi:hypothetical protein
MHADTRAVATAVVSDSPLDRPLRTRQRIWSRACPRTPSFAVPSPLPTAPVSACGLSPPPRTPRRARSLAESYVQQGNDRQADRLDLSATSVSAQEARPSSVCCLGQYERAAADKLRQRAPLAVCVGGVHFPGARAVLHNGALVVTAAWIDLMPTSQQIRHPSDDRTISKPREGR